MIHILWLVLAYDAVIDASSIQAKIARDLKCDTDWTNSANSNLKFRFVELGNVVHTLYLNSHAPSSESAFVAFRLLFIWICFLRIQAATFFDVLECMRRKSTVTPVVIVVSSAIQ